MISLVTGAAGFIGSHLAEKLLDLGHQVLGIDCFSPYYHENTKKENLKAVLKNKNFKFFEQDILTADLHKLLQNVNYVFHEAAEPGIKASFENFKPYIMNNVLATARLLDLAAGSKIKKIIFASSSSVYGDSQRLPLKEEFNPRPISPYAVSKLSCEDLCRAYFRSRGLPAVILRYFTVYGQRQRPDMAVSRMINSALEGKEFLVYGDGKQTRDFTFVSDVVQGTLLAADKGVPGEVYNIGGGSQVPLKDVVMIVSEKSGKSLKVKNIEPSKGDVRDTFADISKAGKTLGYSPKVGIEQGISKQIEWMKA